MGRLICRRMCVALSAVEQKEHDIPVIYLTANAADAISTKPKATHPYAFISKP